MTQFTEKDIRVVYFDLIAIDIYDRRAKVVMEKDISKSYCQLFYPEQNEVKTFTFARLSKSTRKKIKKNLPKWHIGVTSFQEMSEIMKDIPETEILCEALSDYHERIISSTLIGFIEFPDTTVGSMLENKDFTESEILDRWMNFCECQNKIVQVPDTAKMLFQKQCPLLWEKAIKVQQSSNFPSHPEKKDTNQIICIILCYLLRDMLSDIYYSIEEDVKKP